MNLQRRQLKVPPWPREIEVIRTACFPEIYLSQSVEADDAWLVTAVYNDELVGYVQADAGIEPLSCYLREVAVLPVHRHEGTGRRLIGNLADWLREVGFTTVYTDPLEDDLHAIRVTWFEAMGFQQPDLYTMHTASLDVLVDNLSM